MLDKISEEVYRRFVRTPKNLHPKYNWERSAPIRTMVRNLFLDLRGAITAEGWYNNRQDSLDQTLSTIYKYDARIRKYVDRGLKEQLNPLKYFWYRKRYHEIFKGVLGTLSKQELEEAFDDLHRV